MELKEFILDEKPVLRMFPDAARAPPKIAFERYIPPMDGFVYGHIEDDTTTGDQFDQRPNDSDTFFNQDIAW